MTKMMKAYEGNFFKIIKAFCAIAETQNISQAAKILFTSQPALTLQIQTLERKLQCLLFERQGPKLKITPDGIRLYEMAKPLVESLDALPTKFWDDRVMIDQGSVHIAAGESVLLNVLPELMAYFMNCYPAIRLITQTTIARDIPQLLLEDKVEFAFGSLTRVNDKLVQTPIYHFSPMLLIPKGHELYTKAESELTLAQVASYELIMPPEHSYTWQLIMLTFEQHQLMANIRLIAASSEAAKRCVAAGIGLAILTEACLLSSDQYRCVSYEQYFPIRSYSLIERRGRCLSPQALRFKQLTLEWANQQISLNYDMS